MGHTKRVLTRPLAPFVEPTNDGEFISAREKNPTIQMRDRNNRLQSGHGMGHSDAKQDDLIRPEGPVVRPDALNPRNDSGPWAM